MRAFLLPLFFFLLQRMSLCSWSAEAGDHAGLGRGPLASQLAGNSLPQKSKAKECHKKGVRFLPRPVVETLPLESCARSSQKFGGLPLRCKKGERRGGEFASQRSLRHTMDKYRLQNKDSCVS